MICVKSNSQLDNCSSKESTDTESTENSIFTEKENIKEINSSKISLSEVID